MYGEHCAADGTIANGQEKMCTALSARDYILQLPCAICPKTSILGTQQVTEPSSGRNNLY